MKDDLGVKKEIFVIKKTYIKDKSNSKKDSKCVTLTRKRTER
tara:strand:- start:264 stop:389 length:126 start_codon:yes stop_codon:yes gene_type:complete